MNQLRYHHHAARDHAQAAADLLKRAEGELHAAWALFALSAATGERVDKKSINAAEILRSQVAKGWVDASELAN